MSGTLDVLILEKAVELWRDPAKRGYGMYEEDGRYCALGVIIEARSQITGLHDHGYPSKAAAMLGSDWETITNINDCMPFGQSYLYWRMKRALKKAKA